MENGDSFLTSEIQQCLSTRESIVENGVPPRSDDFDIGLESVESEFESNLVVSLSGTSVRDVLTVFGNDDVHHRSGDDGASQRGTEEVDALLYSRLA